MGSLGGSEPARIEADKATLTIESGSVNAKTAGSNEWKNVPDNIHLYEGESLKTRADGRAAISLENGIEVRLDRESELLLTRLDADSREGILLTLLEGKAWVNTHDTASANDFAIRSDVLEVSTTSTVFSFNAPGTVYMIDGTARVKLLQQGQTVRTLDVGVGQQVIATEKIVDDLAEGLDKEVLFAMDDSFKASNWYRWNRTKDSAHSTSPASSTPVIETDESDSGVDGRDNEGSDSNEVQEDEDVGGMTVTVSKPANELETNRSPVAVEGRYGSGVEAVYINNIKAAMNGGRWNLNVNLNEGDNELLIESEEADGSRTAVKTIDIEYDRTAPGVPEIESPGSNSETVTIDKTRMEITGSVSSDTGAVIVNDYRLTRYVPGSGEFKYIADTAYGNLEVGENKYEVIAEDQAGNQSEAATITLVLKQEAIEEEEDSASDTDSEADSSSSTGENTVSESTSSGGVRITAPNGGESFSSSETSFEIRGTVPDDTARVVVNDYTLQGYTPGDSNFLYKTSSSLGNLEIGEVNIYTAVAYDEEDDQLGSASISIDVESNGAGDPQITIPTASGSYTTSLNQLVIGGPVGKWVNRIYVNDEELTDYIPGSQKWRKTVDLQSGENTFIIYGEGSSGETERATITINYQP